MQKNNVSQFEFVALMASLMSSVALAIDALLPALSYIGISIGTQQETDNQLIIIMIFLGLGIGPILFGPISDSFGRKPIVYMGFALFTVASFICIFATSLEIMVIGRILQGIGLSAPRTIAIAMVRDQYSGDYMARIMSFITVVFLLIPMVAPATGKFILDHYNWQAIFYSQLIFSVLISFWFWKRQDETLVVAKRIPFSIHIFTDGLKEVIKHQSTIGYTIISGFISGAFIVYLSSSQQLFEKQYLMKDMFPFIFAGLAIAVGTSTFLNATLVLRFGMEKLVTIALLAFVASSLLYCILYYNNSNPPVIILIIFFALQFFSIGFLFGNLRALAMQPVGHIAGIAAALTGFLSTIMAVSLSTYIGSFINTTAIPLFIGFFICGLLALIVLILINRNKAISN